MMQHREALEAVKWQESLDEARRAWWSAMQEQKCARHSGDRRAEQFAGLRAWGAALEVRDLERGGEPARTIAQLFGEAH